MPRWHFSVLLAPLEAAAAWKDWHLTDMTQCLHILHLGLVFVEAALACEWVQGVSKEWDGAPSNNSIFFCHLSCDFNLFLANYTFLVLHRCPRICLFLRGKSTLPGLLWPSYYFGHTRWFSRVDELAVFFLSWHRWGLIDYMDHGLPHVWAVVTILFACLVCLIFSCCTTCIALCLVWASLLAGGMMRCGMVSH